MTLHLELRGVMARDSAGRALLTSQIDAANDAPHLTITLIAHVLASRTAGTLPRPGTLGPPIATSRTAEMPIA